MLAVSLAVARFACPASRHACFWCCGICALERFSSEIQQGRYGTRFSVGLERDDEHELLRLKRNLNWMAHIETQTKWLHARLDESVSRTRRFEELSFRDALTGLYNRRFFDQFCRILCRDRGVRALFLALIDCDSFKQVNDCTVIRPETMFWPCLARPSPNRSAMGWIIRSVLAGMSLAWCSVMWTPRPGLVACERIRCRFAEGPVRLHGVH